jgi:LDH2 family malate/lactate/ureidoglycolate dehydrogenase
VSHTFIAMAPDVADSGSTLPFSPRLAGYCQLLINEPTADEAIGRVLIPGEPEAQAEREAMDRGIPLDRAHWHRLETIAADVGLILPIPKGEGPAGPGDGH